MACFRHLWAPRHVNPRIQDSMEEDRYIAIGMVGDLLFVVFTERGENIRLISARLATESESPAKKCQ